MNWLITGSIIIGGIVVVFAVLALISYAIFGSIGRGGR